MNDAEVIRGVMLLGSVEVKVLCPAGKGHPVDNVTLCVRDGQLTMRSGHSNNELERRRKEKGGILYADVHMGPTGNVERRCRNSYCKYHLYRNGLKFALELAEFALRQSDPRHVVYRLAS